MFSMTYINIIQNFMLLPHSELFIHIETFKLICHIVTFALYLKTFIVLKN